METCSRIMPLASVKNFRDMGGYTASDGRSIRRGKLFRSGHLSEMTEECAIKLLSKDIGTVIDFRSDSEKKRHPVRWPAAWTPDYKSFSIGGNAAAWIQEMYDRLRETDFPAEELREQLLEAFRTIPIVNKAGLRAFFDCLVDNHKGNAVLFHCTAGKDRTGIAGALLMNALGIDHDQIMEDFLLTNTAVDLPARSIEVAEWLSAKSGRTIQPKDVLPMVGVEAEFMRNCYNVIEETSGTIENYLQQEMGLTPQRRDKLKDRFLTR